MSWWAAGACAAALGLCGVVPGCFADTAGYTLGTGAIGGSGPAATGGFGGVGVAGAGGTGGACPFKLCGGTCVVPSPDVGCSAPGCEPCVVPDNATATCLSGSCAFECYSGYTESAGSCVLAAAGGTGGAPATCTDGIQNGDETGTDCGGSCPACFGCGSGMKRCGGLCVSPTPSTGCGLDGCTPCPPAPPNAVAVCDGTVCSFQCDAGFEPSGALCVPTLSSGGAGGGPQSDAGVPGSDGGVGGPCSQDGDCPQRKCASIGKSTLAGCCLPNGTCGSYSSGLGCVVCQ